MKFNYDKLFNEMRLQGLNKTQLREKAGVSTNVIANMGKGFSIELSNAVKVCDALGIGLDCIDVTERDSLQKGI